MVSLCHPRALELSEGIEAHAGPSKSVVPNIFDIRGWFHEIQVFQGLGWREIVSGCFKSTRFIVYLIIITSLSPKIIRHEILEVGDPCSK